MWRWFAGLLTTTSLAGGVLYGADQRQNPYEDKGTHYELDIKADIEQGERVEIAKDRAAITLKGWNDEYAITIEPQIPAAEGFFGATERPFTVEAERPLLSDRMEYRSGDVTAFIEPKEGTENEFDIDFTLHSKPDTNVFTYKIEGAEEFDFFYQPELTQQQLDAGLSRLPSVIGSYAVYHKEAVNHVEGHTNYQTGKIFHIYRPKAIDAKGSQVWATLQYENGVLSVTVPQEFLNNAIYPIHVDPTFGNTACGPTSAVASATDNINGAQFAAPEDGTITHLTWYNFSDANDDGPLQLALYLRNGGGAGVHSYLADSDEVSGPATNAFVTLAITAGSGSITNATEYMISHWGAEFAIGYDSGEGNNRYNAATTYTGPWPATWSDATATADVRLCMYATYTAAGGSAPGESYEIIFN